MFVNDIRHGIGGTVVRAAFLKGVVEERCLTADRARVQAAICEDVSSIEVESALLAAPGVAEAAVIAVPDDVMGEKVGAVLFGGAETVDVQQVLAHCREQLADFKIPQYIVVSGRPLPRNPGGKLPRAQLRKSVERGAPL